MQNICSKSWKIGFGKKTLSVMFSRTLPQPDRKCVSLGFVGRNQFVLFLEISADFKFQNVMFLFCVKLRKKENHLYFGSNTISYLLFQQLPPTRNVFSFCCPAWWCIRKQDLSLLLPLFQENWKQKQINIFFFSQRKKILAFFFLTDIIVNVCIIFSFFGLDNHWLFWA